MTRTPDGVHRAQFISGLRALAGVLERHPEISLPYIAASGVQWFLQDDKDEMAAIIRAFPCRLSKGTWESRDGQAYLALSGKLDGLKVELHVYRDAVCTRHIVGTEEREVEEVVTPAVVRTVRKQVDVIEWECGPILEPAASPG